MKFWREAYAFIPKAMKICVQFVSLSWITALPWWRRLCNSIKLCAMPCRATQDRRVIVKCFEKMWSTGRGNGNPLQYSCSKKPMNIQISSVQFKCSVMSNSLQRHESQHTRPPCPSPNPGVHSNSCPPSRWCYPAVSSSVIPFFSCPQWLPASESFPMSQLFTWGGQSTGVSASFLPKNTQGLSPSEWTSWISMQSKGLSRVFSNTTVQKHQFFSVQPSSQSKSHIHTWPLEKP